RLLILFGGGILPSRTISSNKAGETPTYAADFTRLRPRGSIERISSALAIIPCQKSGRLENVSDNPSFSERSSWPSRFPRQPMSTRADRFRMGVSALDSGHCYSARVRAIYTGLTPFHEAWSVRPFLGAQSCCVLDVGNDSARLPRFAVEDHEPSGDASG